MKKEVINYLEKNNNEKVIEYKTCKYSGENFPIFEKDLELIEKISPVIAWKKFIYSIPEISPKIRQIMRLAFRNERKLYNIEINWKKLISTVHLEMRKNILETNSFFDTDFSKTNIENIDDFYKDFEKLLHKVPYIDRLLINAENSPYVNQEANPKNCHLVSGWVDNEDCMYSWFLEKCQDMIDCYSCSDNSNNSYESIRVFNSSKIFFSQDIKDSYNIYFSREIINWKNIIFWFDITSWEYIYKDKQYTKEKWEEIYKDFEKKLKTNSWLEELKKEYEEFLKSKKLRWQLNTNSENTIWAMFMNAKDIFSWITVNNSENLRYWAINNNVKNSMDLESYWQWEKLFNVSSGYDNQNTCAVTTHSWASYNTFYSLYVWNSNNCFGCFWLKNKEYCILNKQYSKEEWEEKVVKIIEEKQKNKTWWEFIYPKFSSFPYNDTVAMEYFPPKKVVFIKDNKILNTKKISENWVWIIYVLEPEKFISKAVFDFGWEEKMEIFYRTKEQEINIPEWIEVVFTKDLANNLDEIWDEILNKAIICEVSNRPFRISKKELDFYKKHWISLPRIHYDIRHLNRLNFLPKRVISMKKCEVCKQDKLTNYPDYKNICEDCYNKK